MLRRAMLCCSILSASWLATPAHAQEGVPGEEESSPDDPEVQGDEGEEDGAEAEDDEDGTDDTDEDKPPLLAIEDAVEQAIEARKKVLGGKAYEFCHDKDFETRPILEEKRQCRIFDDDAREACPEGDSFCPEKTHWWDGLRVSLPHGLGWPVIAALLAALLYAFWSVLKKAGFGGDPVDLGPIDDEDLLTGQVQKLPEAPALAILRRARQSLEGGKVEEAALLGQLAMLRYFDDTGLIQFHPSRTNGEYLRAIRRHSELAATYRTLANETDQIRFGSGRADPARIEASLANAAALLGSAPADASGPAAPATALLLVLCLFGQTGCEGQERPFHSHRPTGMAALPELLRELGYTVEIGRYGFDDAPAGTGVAVLRTSAIGPGGLGKDKLDALLDRDIAVVVIDDGYLSGSFLPLTSTRTATSALGELIAFQGEIKPPPVEVSPTDVSDFCGIDLPAIGSLIAPHKVRLPIGPLFRWDGETGTASSSKHQLELYPLLGAQYRSQGRIEARGFGAVRVDDEGDFMPGCILLFTPELFTNIGLAFSGNAGFVGGIFGSLVREGETVVIFDRYAHTKSSNGLGRSIAHSRLLPLIIQGGLWVIGLFILLGAAFGPLRDPVAIEHKAFSEHVNAIGRHYAAAGQAGIDHAGRALSRLLVMRHRHEVRGGHEAGWQAVARHLAAKHRLAEDDVWSAIRLGLTGEATGTGVDRELLIVISTLLSGKKRELDRKQKSRRR